MGNVSRGFHRNDFCQVVSPIIYQNEAMEKFTHQLDDYYYPSSEFHTIPSLFSIF